MEDGEPGEERENRRSQVSTLTLERLLQTGVAGVRGLRDNVSSKEQPEVRGTLSSGGGWLVGFLWICGLRFLSKRSTHYGRRNSKDCKDVGQDC